MSYVKNYKSALIFVITFGLLLVSAFLFSEQSYGASIYDIMNGKASKSQISNIKNSIENKLKSTKAKINELKWREKKEINKLQQNQVNLEKTKKELYKKQSDLRLAKNKLNIYQTNLRIAESEYKFTENIISERIRSIYKGERLSLLHLIINAKDINTFIDRVYFQTKITSYDSKVLNQMKARSDKLSQLTNQVEYQKNNIAYNLNQISNKKKTISRSISNSKYLINKLKTDRKTYEQAEKDLAVQSNKIAKMITNGYKISTKDFEIFSSFIKPVAGRISSPFGWRRHPIFKSKSFHSGIDIAGRNRSPIKASNYGTVTYSGWYGGYGKVVIINHGIYKGKAMSTLYAHMSKTAVKVGDKVKQGQTVGYEGTTGYSTGPHLHFEVRIKGKPTNPMAYLK